MISKRGIINTVSTIILFIVIILVIVDCDTDRGTMLGGMSFSMTGWQWPQILISMGVGFLLGYLFCLGAARRNRL
ncbi:MAG: LapA family protein [Bacteroidetes bacterium]|nr:LapA family protein [Bacteroidota bacterium]